jgi:peroxiredoxin
VRTSSRSQAYPRIRAAGAQLVIITPQAAADAAPYFAEHEPPFPMLVDPDAKVAEAYGLDYDVPPYMIELYRNGLDTDLTRINAGCSWRLPTPARFVIDRSGTIVDARLNPDYRFRFDPAESIAALERLHIRGARG